MNSTGIENQELLVSQTKLTIKSESANTLSHDTESVNNANQEKLPQQQSQQNSLAVDFHEHSLQIAVGDDKQIHVKVIDNQTGELIREIPPKTAMQLLSDWTGIWVDLKA